MVDMGIKRVFPWWFVDANIGTVQLSGKAGGKMQRSLVASHVTGMRL